MTTSTPSRRLAAALRLRYQRAQATRDTSGQRPDVEPPPIDYTRPPPTRPPPVDPPPTRPPYTRPPPTSEWPKITTFKHSVWGEVGNDTFKTYQGVEFGASGPTTGLAHAVLNHPAGMLHEGMVYDNCRWIGLGGADCNMRWGLRAFDLLGPRFNQCEFTGKLWEHGAYLGAPQGVDFTDCRFDGMRAAGYQEAHRYWGGYTHETIIPEGGKVLSLKTFRRCVFKNLGDPKSERFGAFSLSLHPGEIWLPDGSSLPDINADVLLDSCQFIGGNFEHNYSGQIWKSNRAWMVGNRKSLTIQDSYFDCPQPVHGWSGQSHNTPEVTLLRSEFIGGGKIEVKNASKVRIEGCTGDAWIRVGTGPGLGEGLTQVEYEGPIKNAFSKGLK